MKRLLSILENWKYELLLYALVQHLYISVFFKDMDFYMHIIWPFNMIFLGLASVGVFLGKGKWLVRVKNLLLLLVVFLPIFQIFKNNVIYLQVSSLIYMGFFFIIFGEVIKFLLKPKYINLDLLMAAGCGYFLLIEISAFMLQFLVYNDPSSMAHLDMSSVPNTFVDMVYYASIIQTSIGFGDITPLSHTTKMVTSFFGVMGQIYNVVLVGILISKFSTANQNGKDA
ncbi:potassium channel family protein [Echinicola marina]|uniref:potassium channel family protein n=1 Tax=Echinicola marina TaxID=2859768 RepID=UPI001CF66D09|nr:potassium channel family protein [Echinicola marina]UCS94545.1 potassium channel family protein [Echinicola marina]